MNCQQAQANLSLYLYGELDFAQEEELEKHLSQCAFCEMALAREKSWHAALTAERTDVPLDLLSRCRQDLRAALGSARVKESTGDFEPFWRGFFGNIFSQWSLRIAVASFLVLVGFSAARLMDRSGITGRMAQPGGVVDMGLVSPYASHIRYIQPDENDRVRIVIDQVREREITGSPDDQAVRQLLLAAMKDPADPGIRVDSVDILKNQNGTDIRDALLYSVRHDPNAGVRLKAVEGLSRFADDPATKSALKFVLEHDDNPGVRSEAINVLAPMGSKVEVSPELAGTLEDVIRSDQEDEYVRMRCLQILHDMNAAMNMY